jgi:multiple sugar transport system substrate-binding protein
MKKLILSLLIVFLLITILPIYGQKTVEITFWYCMTRPQDMKSIEEIVADFNKKHPYIRVKVLLVPGAETEVTKLMTAIAAGTGPDVYYLDRFTVAQRANEGVLEPLEDWLVKAGVNVKELKKGFFDFAIKEATFKGKLYAMPWDTDDRVLYYNKKLFKEAGLDPNKPPRTIAELDAYAEKLTKIKDNVIEVFGFIPWYSQGWHYTWGWAFSGEFYNERLQRFTFGTDKRIIESFKWQKKYADKYGMATIGAFLGIFGPEIDPFIAGKLAMKVDGSWYLTNIRDFAPKDFEWGMSQIPSIDGRPTTWAGGWSLVIPKGAKNPQEAAEFIAYIGTEGQVKYAVDTAHLPTWKAGFPALLKVDPDQKLFADLLAVAKCRPVVPVGALVWDKLTEARDYVLYGQKTAEQALKDAQKECQNALDRALGKK